MGSITTAMGAIGLWRSEGGEFETAAPVVTIEVCGL